MEKKDLLVVKNSVAGKGKAKRKTGQCYYMHLKK